MVIDFKNKGADQEYFEFFCPLEKEFTKFVTTIDNPDKVVCTKCSYKVKKSEGVTNKPKSPQEKYETYLDKLKSLNSSN